jgi:hypothetical protein
MQEDEYVSKLSGWTLFMLFNIACGWGASDAGSQRQPR